MEEGRREDFLIAGACDLVEYRVGASVGLSDNDEGSFDGV